MARAVSALILAALSGWAIAAIAARPADPLLPAAPARKPQVRMKQEPIPPSPAVDAAPDLPEAGSAEAIAGLTSALRLLPPPVAYVPDDPVVPSPARFLGHVAGDPAVAHSADLALYLRGLAAATRRVRVQGLGTSEEGREILLVTISEAHNLAESGYFQETAARLADPRRTAPRDAARLVEAQKILYYVVGGRQAGDLASPEMLAELAYRLAVSERADIKSVRENSIVLITPVAEPDAYDRAVDWYRSQLNERRGLAWDELRQILAPPYAGHYGGAAWTAAGDTGLGLASTRAVAAAFFGNHPQLVQALGTSAPLLSLGGTAPASGMRSPDGAGAGADLAGGADPWPQLAAAVAAKLRGYGMPGVHVGADDGGSLVGGGAAGEPGAGGGANPAISAGAAGRTAGGIGAAGEGRAAGEAGAAPGGSPEVALALDHGAAAGVIGVFGNGTAGAFERTVGVLEEAAAPAPAGGDGPGKSGGQASRSAGREPPGMPRGVPGGRPQGPQGAQKVRTAAAAWPPGGRLRWSLRDSVNYAESATLEALAWAAAHRRELVAGSWQRAADAWEQARGEAPYAWIFPPRQADAGRLAALVRRLRGQQIEVHRLSAEAVLGERRWAAGSYVVRLDQPYRRAALRFLRGDAEGARSGGTGMDGGAGAVPWPLLYGVTGGPVDAAAILAAPMVPVAEPAPPAGRIVDTAGEGDVGEGGPSPAAAGAVAGATGGAPGAGPAGEAAGQPRAGWREGEVFLLRDTGQSALLAARLALGNYQVDAAEGAFKAGGRGYPAGSWIVQAPRRPVEAVAHRLGLTFAASATLPEVPRHVVYLPRLAVLHGWTATEPSSWVRWAFDRAQVPYSLIADEDLRRGGLRERFDLILMASTGTAPQAWPGGLPARWSPLAYLRVAAFPSLGVPDGAADITGGAGDAGVRELRRFVEDGGILATLGDASAALAGAGFLSGFSAAAAGAPGAAAGAQDSGTTGAEDSPPGAPPGPVPPDSGSTGAEDSGVAGAPGFAVAGAAAGAPPGVSAPSSADAAGAANAPGTAELRAFFTRRDHPLSYGFSRSTQVMRRGGPMLDLAPALRGGVVLRFGPPDTADAAGGGAEDGAGHHAADAASAANIAEDSGDSEDAVSAAGAVPVGPAPAVPPAPAIEVEDMGAGKAPSAAPTPADGADELRAGDDAPDVGPADPLAAPPRPLGSRDGRLLLAGSPAAGAAALSGRPAVVDLPLGRGHLVAFAFDPFDPAEGPADMRLIANLLLNWHALPPAPR
jgi:hypothetical protein